MWHPTVSSCQLSMGDCYQQSVCIIIWQCDIIAFVSFLTDILSMSYYILTSFCVQISPLVESVYWFSIVFLSHIVFPHLCWVNFLFCWTLICTLCSHSRQCSVLGIVSLCWVGCIKAEILVVSSDLTELHFAESYKRNPQGIIRGQWTIKIHIFGRDL